MRAATAITLANIATTTTTKKNQDKPIFGKSVEEEGAQSETKQESSWCDMTMTVATQGTSQVLAFRLSLH